MKVTQNNDFLLGLFFLLFQYCLGQRGYNYVRPSIVRGSSSTTAVGSNIGLPATSVSNSLRPVVAAIPTGTGFATTPTAFGAPSTANVVPTAAAFGGFQGNIATGLSPTAPSTGIGGNFVAGTTASGFPSRSPATQRSGTGLFGSGIVRGQSTQFTSSPTSATGSGSDVDYESDGDFSAIPGIPGVNYPIYSQVPQTSFDCAQQALPGYYSDVEAQCQVFHICALNRTYSFLCPNGTVFSQEVLVCVWWNQYDCSTAPALYANNAFIYDYGNEGVAPNAGSYQGAQVGISGTTRPQSGFQIATNTGRTTAAPQTGIFGSSVDIRPTVTSGGFGRISNPLTPAPAFAGGNIAGQTSTGRLQQASIFSTAQGQAFPDSATMIGNIVRGGSDATGIISSEIGGQQTLQTAQLSTSSTNREYLPPARRS